MSTIVFQENDKTIGVFDDRNIFKTKSFHYILELLINKGYFKTKKQCGVKIKDDLKLLYDDSEYTFKYKDIKFGKLLMEMNTLDMPVKPVANLEDALFICYSISDISKPLDMLDVKDLFTQK